MNNLRQFCAVLILTLALTVSTFAGQIECGGFTATPSSTEAVAGEMPNGVESTDALTEFVISLLNMLTLI